LFRKLTSGISTRMKIKILIFCLSSIVLFGQAQPSFIWEIFPTGTVYHQNIAYAGDTLKKHQLDIYLPAHAKSNTPLIIWVHGGAWQFNDKYADMGYMKQTLKTIIEKGYALASIDYRHSTTAVFPAQILDCNQAVEFLFQNAGRYGLDKSRFALFGFSAGGHLASLLALSGNNEMNAFYPGGKKPAFKIKTVVDYYGPSDFLLFFGIGNPEVTGDPISTLLGHSPLKRPDISKLASPTNYVDKGDPTFFIVHGEKDESVPPALLLTEIIS
jgi:acetyl esterase/lipase